MTLSPEQAKQIIKELDLTGVGFAELMGRKRNYVSDFNIDGVPKNIAIILTLAKELKALKANPVDIIKNLNNHGKTLDNEND